VWHGAKPGGNDGKHLNHNDVEETGPQIKTVEELLGQSEQQLAKIICKVLKERPHRTAKKNDIVKFVCKRYGVITRGTPRTKLERKIGRSLNRLIKEGLVEEYRSKNLRVRFIGRY
jgi:dTDP-D-glucose 4,6-dehydratase